MANLTKKQKANSKKQLHLKVVNDITENINRRDAISASLKIKKSELKTKAEIVSKRAKASAQNVPAWVKALPASVRARKNADKKKKKYRSFRLQKKIKPEPRYIPSSLGLIKASFKFLYVNKKIFFVIFLIHIVLYAAVVRSPLSTDITSIQKSVKSVLGEESNLQSDFATLGAVIGTSGADQADPTTISISVALMSLVYIWAIRQLHTNKTVKARDAYYQGLAPIASGLIVFLVAAIQLIPFAAAGFVYSTARSGGLFVTGFEDLAGFIITVLTGLLSFYWMTSTIIALYIVTLPGMYPMQALRAAKKLVQFQRFMVFRRIVALPVILGLVYATLLLVLIRVASSQVLLIAEVLQLLILPLVHVYFYKLYRALI